MPITTAQLKAAIEAKIAAATGSTSLEDLTLIKNNADTWLANNSSGTITGYASLETLIQSKQDALTGSSTIDDVTLTSAAVFPPTVAKSLVWKTQTFLTSGTFTRPAKMVGDTVWLTGCAAGGGGTMGWSQTFTWGGFGGSYCVNRPVRLTAGFGGFTVVIPAGGVAGSAGSRGGKGGNLQFGSGPVLLTLKGGDGGYHLYNNFGNISYIAAAVNNVFFDGVRPLLALPSKITQAGTNESSQVDIIPPETVMGFNAGRSSSYGDNITLAGGGAAGLYGDGVDCAASPVTQNNTGAGGASSVIGASLAPSNGSSGRLDIGWWEYE